MPPIQTIAFDADDTLWVNETIFTQTQEHFTDIIRPYVRAEELGSQLDQTQIRNLSLFGYGIKGFMLSMIETGLELSDYRLPGTHIQQLLELGKEMLQHPVQLLPHVEETIRQLEGEYPLMIITKGDLFDQESKIARSGLADYFSSIEIVSEKNQETYRRLLRKHSLSAEAFLMVGNSLKSDVLPVCQLGGHAVHIPFHTTWVHEQLTPCQLEGYGYQELENMSQLPAYLQQL
ncbi:HAD family hydrolase [Cesiribacter andamanensis]|uniref:DUMP phosphatase n=1 Tax=Cesiribacter andamanensis AMV16 TaxID=1279009 RepID=M7MXC0_9BACT|nr:HAD family hydrolase [Cesiribacter andamanensis]EMR01083.1 dUMP phosphatase [Cesiribacter andamanensis AMV16]